jgi:predicted phage baseplate assembly protein
MTLPAPTLDDRRFQELVDEAKRRISDSCPEWTDHNVSDPGVTLVELFAWMTDQIIYRLNRVPDRLYVKFLEMVGVSLVPPEAARADVTFWLSRPQDEVVVVPTGTEVATVRSEIEPAVVFTIVEPLVIEPCSSVGARSVSAGGEERDHANARQSGEGFLAFDDPPTAGDALHVILSNAVPSGAVRLRLTCDEAFGQGIDPRRPPLVWEAWDGKRWRGCEWDDRTGGLNHDGEVVVHVHRHHAPLDEGRQRRAELRCRVLEPGEDRPSYERSPRITGLTAATIGGTGRSVHAELIVGELLGRSTGVPAQRFSLRRRPVVPSERPLVIETVTDGKREEWTEVANFSESGAGDTHFRVEHAAGEIVFGPAVRDPDDGRLRHYGRVPPRDAELWIREYRTGGGRGGNVARRAIQVLKTAIPYIARVENRGPGTGGTDGEKLEDAKIRGALELHRVERAVTPEDYERLTREAGAGVTRVVCVAAADEGPYVGVARVVVVPRVPVDAHGRVNPADLIPSDDALERVRSYLEERRVIGARFVVQPAQYKGLRINALVRLLPGAQPKEVVAASIVALNRYFNPITGGAKGDGWPFGREVYSGEAQLVLQRVRGVEFVQEVKLFPVDLESGDRGEEAQRIDLDRDTLIVSHEHMVAVADDA